ncbi:hypothetical protein FE257_000204 [Aspergillus nanangensis]|uniref:Hemerythrin-like domain-containing protein n=1 Tax=Aspergillus nanangensis TaxID=2582783 RepID=A0AAD4H011_ASPNN|nr:hypothetical protein FE257_000204 [Aspergillus nanangensis]
MKSRISDTIKEDHREIEACYYKIIHSTDRDEQIRFQNLLTWDLARLLVGEELVVYPAIEKHVFNGHVAAERDRHINQTVKEDLKKFQDLDPSNPEFTPAITALMGDFSQHVHGEESTDLVQLEQSLSEKESEKLARSFGRTKIFMPSRAHPGAPHNVPFETAVGLLTAPFDQVADLFRKWPRHA